MKYHWTRNIIYPKYHKERNYEHIEHNYLPYCKHGFG